MPGDAEGKGRFSLGVGSCSALLLVTLTPQGDCIFFGDANFVPRHKEGT